MSENIGEGVPQKRRDILKKTGAVIGGVAAGAFLRSEVKASTTGSIITENGIFTPLYERHDIPPSPEKVLPTTNIFFCERANTIGGESMGKILSTPQKYSEHFIEPDVLERLAVNHTDLMFGDIDIGNYRNQRDKEHWAKVAVSFASGAATLGILTHQKELDKRVGIPRRRLLKGTAAAIGAWGISESAGISTLVASEDVPVLERVAKRFNGLQSHVHPEDRVLFFRNLVIADKLLLAAEDYKKRTREHANIVYNVGKAHGGIEDLLRAGPDVCRFLISLYPRSLLRDIVERNNGSTTFSSARIASFPPDIPPEDVRSKENLLHMRFQERWITDHVLESKIKQIIKE